MDTKNWLSGVKRKPEEFSVFDAVVWDDNDKSHIGLDRWTTDNQSEPRNQSRA